MAVKYKDFGSGLFMLLLGLALFISSQSIPTGAEMGAGPDFMPKLMSALLAISGTILTVQGWFSKRSSNPDGTAKPAEKRDYAAVILSLVYLLAYILLLTRIGFLVMTVLYTFLQISLFAPKEKRGRKNYVLFGIISVAATVVIYFIFVYGFNLLLPAGILG